MEGVNIIIGLVQAALLLGIFLKLYRRDNLEEKPDEEAIFSMRKEQEQLNNMMSYGLGGDEHDKA